MIKTSVPECVKKFPHVFCYASIGRRSSNPGTADGPGGGSGAGGRESEAEGCEGKSEVEGWEGVSGYGGLYSAMAVAVWHTVTWVVSFRVQFPAE